MEKIKEKRTITEEELNYLYNDLLFLNKAFENYTRDKKD